MAIHNKLLITGGILIFLIALIHVYIALVGADLYIYFGAGEEYYQLDKSGSITPMIHTLILAILFLGCAFYGLAGLQPFFWLPWRNPCLFIISSIFLLRGLVIFYEIVKLFQNYSPITLRFLFFSLYSLSVGIVFLAGTLKLIQYEKTV